MVNLFNFICTKNICIPEVYLHFLPAHIKNCITSSAQRCTPASSASKRQRGEDQGNESEPRLGYTTEEAGKRKTVIICTDQVRNTGYATWNVI